MSERAPIDGEPETHAGLMGALAIGLVRDGLEPEVIGAQLLELKAALDERAAVLATSRQSP